MTTKLFHIAVPMKNYFSHALKIRKNSEVLILEINHNNCSGIGECVPRPYVSGETIEGVIADLLSVNLQTTFNFIDFTSVNEAIKSLKNLKIIYWLLKKKKMNVACIIELALLDFIGNYFKCSVFNMLKNANLLDGLITNKSKKNTFRTTQVFDFSISNKNFIRNNGPFNFVKIKLGKNSEENVKRVSYIRKNISQDVPISVDANMSWSYFYALKMISKLKPFNIKYYEELLPKESYIEYKMLRQKTRIKILLDESICNIENAVAALKQNACDAFNIRISKCGGVLNSIKLIRLALSKDIKYQIGAHVGETGPLIAAGRQLVKMSENHFAFEAGQPDRFFHSQDYIINPMPLVNRSTNLARSLEGPGLGISLKTNINRYIKKKYFRNYTS